MDRIALSPDGSLLALALGKQFVFGVEKGDERRQIENPGSHVLSLAVSPDNCLLLASAWGRRREVKLDGGRIQLTTEKEAPVTLWDLETGAALKTFTFPDNSAGAVAFSTTGSRFAVAVSKPKDKIIVYDAATGAESQIIEGVSSRVRSLCFGRDGKTLVSGMADSSAIVWELE
jgi:WD40 repeat protein